MGKSGRPALQTQEPTYVKALRWDHTQGVQEMRRRTLERSHRDIMGYIAEKQMNCIFFL